MPERHNLGGNGGLIGPIGLRFYYHCSHECRCPQVGACGPQKTAGTSSQRSKGMQRTWPGPEIAQVAEPDPILAIPVACTTPALKHTIIGTGIGRPVRLCVAEAPRCIWAAGPASAQHSNEVTANTSLHSRRDACKPLLRRRTSAESNMQHIIIEGNRNSY